MNKKGATWQARARNLHQSYKKREVVKCSSEPKEYKHRVRTGNVIRKSN